MSLSPTFHPEFKRKATEAARLQSQILGHQLRPFMDPEAEPPLLLTYCQKCGMRVTIAARDHTLSGEALTQQCDGQQARAAQMEAYLTGLIPAQLLRRLQAAVEALEPDLRARFDPGHFDSGSWRLCSDDGVLAMRWEQPENPDYATDEDEDEPSGFTELVQLVPAETMRQARYTGPRLNPNGHENPKHWLVIPLEPGEEGLAYRDVNDRWRFRREDGVVGYFVERRHLTLGKAGSPNTPINILPSAQQGGDGEEEDAPREKGVEETGPAGAG